MNKKFEHIKRVLAINNLCLLILTTILTIFYVVLSNEKKDTSANNASAYNFDSGVLTEANYNYYSTFEINTPQGLINFSKTPLFAPTARTMFTKKTVKLTATIDMSFTPAETWRPIGSNCYVYSEHYNEIWTFDGTFDGGGFTIKNLSQNVHYNNTDMGQCTKAGLFYSLSGDVCNLRIENFTVTLLRYGLEGNHTSHSNFAAGAVAIYATGDAQINQVEVSNFAITTQEIGDLGGFNESFPQYYPAPICGLVALTANGVVNVNIRDCYAENIKLKLLKDTSYGYIGYYNYKIVAIGPVLDLHSTEAECYLYNCVNKPYSGSDYETATEFAGSNNTGFTIHEDGCITETCTDANFETTYSKFAVMDNYGSTSPTITKVLSARYKNSEPIWFYNEGYNGGYARLTQFMDVKYQFYIPDDCVHQGTLDKTSVTIRYGLGVKTTNEEITLDGSQTKKGVMLLGNTTINATPKIGYSFVNWVFDSMVMSNNQPMFKCKPIFTSLYYTLTFESVNVGGITVNPKFYNNENAFTASGNELQILGGGEVTVNINKEDNIYSYIVTGNIKIGNSVTNTTVYVQYDLGNLRRYTIDSFKIGASSIKTNNSYEIVKDESVKPTFTLKSYNSIFR